MADVIRIAAAQTTVACDPATNGAEIRRLMRLARECGARLVHFPEGAASGYPGTAVAKARLRGWQVDWAALRDQLEVTAETANDLGMWVVLGSAHPLTAPHRPHNSMYVVSDRGELVTRYDKRLLSYTEVSDWYAPGTEPVVFEVDGFRFGCALCIEIQFPEVFLEYGRAGVDCVLFSTFSEDPLFDVLARGHAATNCFWISVAVPAQYSAAMPAGVIGPHGSWLRRGPMDGAGAVVCVDLDHQDSRLEIALHRAKPWRARARKGKLYDAARVSDHRSTDRRTF